MKCPLCNIDMHITGSKNIIEHDDTPNEETKLYRLQELRCRNENCENYNRVVETLKIELPIG